MKSQIQPFRGFVLIVSFFAAIFLLRAAPREDINLVDGWKFFQGDITNAEQTGFRADDWSGVSLPHCWGWEQAQRGKMYYRGPGWYRRGLNLGVPQPGKRYFVRFEAASSVADVYLNGQFLGEHRGGFGAFGFEITTNLAANGTNLLAVRVSNAPEPDIAPLSGDFPVYGGIYRPVHVIVTGAENFTLTDHASPGVEWLQSHITSKEAVLDIRTEISNGTKKKQPFTLVARVLDVGGKEVVTTQQNITLEPVVTEPFNLQIKLADPHLWNGRKDPYLYHAVVELRSGNEIVDSVVQTIGLRFYHVDPDKGFFLNGKHYPLNGVDRHQDRPDKGWAISEADQDEDMALLKEIGATVIRCAHYQHSDYFYSLCDKAGILVWAEIPQVDRITAGPKFEETSRNQLLDLIRQNINHPSIFVWSLFNELRPGNPDPHRELADLNILSHGEDPTRPTIAATCTDGWPQMNKIPDQLGWNIYPGWYPGWGTKDDFGKLLDRYRYTSQRGGICVSEYGAGANVTQHENNPHQPVADSQWHPEEWQAIVHESAWQAIKVRPFVWASFVWNMFDFTSYWRHEGGVLGRNDKGLVSYDRRTKKDAFYFYKANWSDEPVLYITDRRFIERTNSVTDVKIYSNAGKVELFINGKSQGVCPNDGNDVFNWPSAKLAAGENEIEAQAKRAGQNLTDTCRITVLPPQAVLRGGSKSAGE
jgi:beta-galactosidase